MVIPSNNKDTFSLVKGLLICLSTRYPKAMLNELVLLIKLNVDAAFLKDDTRLAVIARDEYGKVIKAWAKEHILCDFIMVEAFSIL